MKTQTLGSIPGMWILTILIGLSFVTPLIYAQEADLTAEDLSLTESSPGSPSPAVPEDPAVMEPVSQNAPVTRDLTPEQQERLERMIQRDKEIEEAKIPEREYGKRMMDENRPLWKRFVYGLLANQAAKDRKNRGLD